MNVIKKKKMFDGNVMMLEILVKDLGSASYFGLTFHCVMLNKIKKKKTM